MGRKLCRPARRVQRQERCQGQILLRCRQPRRLTCRRRQTKSWCIRLRDTLKGHNGAVMALRFGPVASPLASSLFSCCMDLQLRRWSIAAKKCEMEYTGNLLLADKGGKASALPSVGGKRGHVNEVHNFAFSPDGRCICSVGYKGIMGTDCDQTKLWDVQNRKLHVQLQGALEGCRRCCSELGWQAVLHCKQPHIHP